MSKATEDLARTRAALAAAIGEGRFEGDDHARAAAVLARLEQPTRVTIMGMPGIGKTVVVNLLAGTKILPEGRRHGTVQLVHGESVKSDLVLPDGSSVTVDGRPRMVALLDRDPVFMKLHLKLPSLAKVSLLELPIPTERPEQKKAIAWAAKQTDIAVWCTKNFDAAERAVWDHMPDEIKGHSVLLRVRADTIFEEWAHALRDLEDAAGQHFAACLLISAREALAACGSDGRVDRELLRDSGGTALISGILRLIERLQQRSIEDAKILLGDEDHRPNGADAARPVENEARREAKPAPNRASANGVRPKRTRIRPVDPDIDPADHEPSEEIVAQIAADDGASSDIAAVPDESLAPNTAARAKVDTPIEVDAPIDAAVLLTFEKVTARIEDLGQALRDLDAPDTASVLEASTTTLTWMNEQLADDDLPAHPMLRRMRHQTQAADDLLQLLRIEETDDGAVDAVSAMLQLKRSLQAARHA